MNAVAQTLAACIASGAVFASICAALAIPVFAWVALRALAPAIHNMNGDWRAQASAAACAASIPGALFLFLVAYGLATGASSSCMQTIPGRLLFGVLVVIMLAAIARALAQAFRRSRDASRAVAMALPAPPRLAKMAAQAGVNARLLPEEERSVVMLYGDREPVVYVSTKALRDFSDRELLAALYHERAHQTRCDNRIASLLYFLADLLPLPVADLVTTYRRSREFCADECALQHVAAPDLASALLQMIAPQSAALAHAAAFAETSVVHDRLRALLMRDSPRPNGVYRAFVATALIGIMVAGVAVPQIASFAFHCSKIGMPS